jgi:hypothetical protein
MTLTILRRVRARTKLCELMSVKLWLFAKRPPPPLLSLLLPVRLHCERSEDTRSTRGEERANRSAPDRRRKARPTRAAMISS